MQETAKYKYAFTDEHDEKEEEICRKAAELKELIREHERRLAEEDGIRIAKSDSWFPVLTDLILEYHSLDGGLWNAGEHNRILDEIREMRDKMNRYYISEAQSGNTTMGDKEYPAAVLRVEDESGERLISAQKTENGKLLFGSYNIDTLDGFPISTDYVENLYNLSKDSEHSAAVIVSILLAIINGNDKKDKDDFTRSITGRWADSREVKDALCAHFQKQAG